MPKGTFLADGDLGDELLINKSVDLSLVFGAGTVVLERYMNDDWREVMKWTKSTEDTIHAASPKRYRLRAETVVQQILWEIS